MASIFISYNRKSAFIAKALAEDIEAIGHVAWYDNDLSGGQAWWDQILAKVRTCDIFVFVLDMQALNSTACIREYVYADQLGKPILPILGTEGVSLNLLPAALSKIQFVDYRIPDRNAAFKLARALSAIPTAQPLPTPLPAPPEVPLSYLGGLSSKVDTASTLTYEEQSALVLDLKSGLADNESVDDTRILLKRLRKRRDLYVPIADNIDELLSRSEGVDKTDIDTAVKKVSGVQIHREELQKDNKNITISKAQLRKSLVRGLISGLIGAIISKLIYLLIFPFGKSLYGYEFEKYDLDIGVLFMIAILWGSIGAIAGTNKKLWLSAIITALLPLIIWIIYIRVYNTEEYSLAAILFLMALSGIFGMFIIWLIKKLRTSFASLIIRKK